jgi:hypothetical protein
MGGGYNSGRAGQFFGRADGLNRFGRFGASTFGYPAFGYPAFYSPGYPGYYSNYYPDPFYQTDEGYQQTPNVVIVMPQVQAPEPPPPPPTPAQPVMHEYHWPDTAASLLPATFSLVSRNGTVQFALAVWVQDNELRFTALDGTIGRLPLATVDRDATERLNAEKHLKLRLPPRG